MNLVASSFQRALASPDVVPSFRQLSKLAEFSQCKDSRQIATIKRDRLSHVMQSFELVETYESIAKVNLSG